MKEEESDRVIVGNMHTGGRKLWARGTSLWVRWDNNCAISYIWWFSWEIFVQESDSGNYKADLRVEIYVH